MQTVLASDEQTFVGATFYAMVLGFAPDTPTDKIQQTVDLCLQNYQLDKLVVLLNSSDPTLHEQLMQNHKVYSISKPVIHTKLLQALLQPRPPAQTLTLAVEQQKEKLPLRVLAVDDNPANLKLIVALLHDLVQEVYSCQNGHQAVAQAEKTRFDLIFMDIHMPVLDGIDAAKLIKSENELCDIPIIALTAKPQKDTHDDDLFYFDEFLEKQKKLSD